MDNDVKELIAFMQGAYQVTFSRMIWFFSEGNRYLHPRELKVFWESLTPEEEQYYSMELSDIWIALK